VRDTMVEALTGSVMKCVGEGLALAGARFSVRDLWVALFRQTYRTELRAEPPARAGEIYDANAAHYEKISAAVLAGLGAVQAAEAGSWQRRQRPAATGGKWLARRVQGKLLSVARLMKAAFTFQDGAHYLLWKIERHSGVTITLTPWQRRHPILASTVLFWRLYRKGAFR